MQYVKIGNRVKVSYLTNTNTNTLFSSLLYCLLLFSRKRFYHSIANRQSLVNEATWSKMLFYLLFLFPFTSFPILCSVDAVTVLENFLST